MKNALIALTLISLLIQNIENLAPGGGGGGGGISISPPPTPQEVLPPKPIIVAPIFVKQKHHKRRLMTYHTGFPGNGPAGMFPPPVTLLVLYYNLKL
jgi:hypothetical protein